MIRSILHHMCYILKSIRTESQPDLSCACCCLNLLCMMLKCFFPSSLVVCVCVCPQQIDDMLAGSLTQEDEDAVLAELEAITQVCTWTHSYSPCYWCCVSWCVFIYLIYFLCVLREMLTLNFLRCLEKNYQRFQSKSQVCVFFFSISLVNIMHTVHSMQMLRKHFCDVSVREKERAKKKPEREMVAV